MLKFTNFFLLIFLIFHINQAFGLESNWDINEESQVRIVSPLTNIDEKNILYVGLEYKLEEGWKTYWKSPGEGGFPQRINWKSSKNINKLDILWPTPSYFEILGFTSIGYKKEVLFPLKIEIQDPKKAALINLKVEYLVCKDICIPGNANLQLIIPPGKAQITKHYFTLQKALSLIPRLIEKKEELEILSSKAYIKKNKVSIEIQAESENIIQNAKFFIHSEFGLPVVKPKISFSPNSKKINASFDFNKNNIDKKEFFLNIIFQKNNTAFEFIENLKIEKISNITIFHNSLFYIFFISILGGIILNLMPCVLPVLSIKILSVLKSSESKLSIGKSFFVTSIGIISSFAFLALTLIFLRYLGVNIGWGMQFQQPLFLIIIAIILLLFTFNLFGFFEFKIPSFVNSLLIKDFSKNYYLKDFFNGFFATVLATPCSAPFVGSALTVAFTQSSFTMFGIFVLMGFGMASPYLILTFFPNLTFLLPKPGIWMKYLKYFLGLLIFLTFIWILSILMNHISPLGSLKKQSSQDWIDFNTIKLENLKKENDLIFVDITADWCATCQYNKINVINSKIISEKFKQNNIIMVKGDWTKPNDNISNFLKKYQRYGIPFNILYSKNFPEGIILSEILTKKELISSIEKIK